MQGIKNLFSDAHGFIAGLLILGATVLAALGVMPLDKWISYTQVIFVGFAGSHALISAADSYAVGKMNATGKGVVDVVKEAAEAAAKTAVVLLVFFAATASLAACSSNPKILAGEKAALSCAVDEVQKYAGQVEGALKELDYTGALKTFAKQASLADKALKCLVETVVAVLSTPSETGSGSAVASTQQPSIVVVNGKAWLQANK